MEPRAVPSEELDLHELFFKFRTHWKWFLASLLLAGFVAWVYLQVKPPVYDFRASMLLGDQNTGSKRAQELLQLLEVKEKGVKMEDEIGLITSADIVQRTLQQLPFTVSYFEAPDSWLNLLRNVQVRESASGGVPFRVTPAPKTPQLTGVPIYVEALADGRFRVHADAEKGEMRELATGELVRTVQGVHLDEIVAPGQPLQTPLLSAVITPDPAFSAPEATGRYFFRLNDLASLTADYQSRLKVRPIDHESRIIELSIRGSVPEKQTQFLNMLMATFVQDDLRQKNQTGSQTVSYLDSEINKLAQSRQQSAAALSSFRTASGVVDVGAQSNAGIQQLSELEMMRAKVATNRKYYQNILGYLRQNQASAQVAAPSSVGIDDPAVNTLILQLTNLNSQRAALGVNASTINPQLLVLDEQIQNTKQSLSQTLANMTRAADITLRDLDQQLGRVRGQMSQMPENERRLASLKTRSDFNEKNYNFLVEKRNEAAIALATNSTDKKIVDRAEQVGTGPAAPKLTLVALLTLLAGLAVPAGLVVLLHKSTRLIHSKEDLSRLTDIPLIGVVGHGTPEDLRVMMQAPKGRITESFRSIRVNFQYLSAGLDKRVIGVTSSVPGEGKTFCAVNLAVEMAQSGRRVLLLECDLRRPTVAGYFNLDLDPAHGLGTYLVGLSGLNQVCYSSGIQNLDLIPCGPIPSNPTQLLEGPRMVELLQLLRQEYDYVIVDTPPVGYVAEFFVLLRYLDANIYVVRQNYTERHLVNQINDLYKERKVRDIYMVINDMHFEKTYEYRYKEKAYTYTL